MVNLLFVFFGSYWNFFGISVLFKEKCCVLGWVYVVLKIDYIIWMRIRDDYYFIIWSGSILRVMLYWFLCVVFVMFFLLNVIYNFVGLEVFELW